ncbi:unnamed protein product, partial [Allacma fusca]
MDALMSRRKLLKAKLTRIKKKLDVHGDNPINLHQARIYEEQISEAWAENKELFDEIISTCNEEDDEEHENQFSELADRFDEVKLAIRTGHNSMKCFSKSTCKKCEAKHNTLLHLDQTAAVDKKEAESGSAHTAQTIGGNKRALLATVLVNITDCFGQVQNYRALLDPGADVSFVSERCVQQLGVSRSKSDMHFSGLGANSVGKSR